MNKLFLAAIMVLSFGLYACNNSAGSPTISKYKRDTTKAVIMLLGYRQKEVVGPSVAYRISLDTMMMTFDDTTRTKMSIKWSRFTYYNVYLDAMTDSINAAELNIKEFDSTGKHYRIVIRQDYPPIWVRDSVTNYDSAKSQLQKLLPDTTKQK